MSSFNDALKNIRLRNLAVFIVATYFVLSVLSRFTNGMIGTNLFYVIVIFYFMFMLKGHLQGLKSDFVNVFESDLKYILLVVLLNILFSYGMLYLSGALISHFPFLDFMVNPSKSLIDSLPVVGGFIATVIVSPISEELIFRGVFLNRLKLFVPTVFAIFISSLLFGALHPFGSMTSAVVFAVCMAILYLRTENICVPIFAHFLNNLLAEIIRLADVNNVLFTNDLVVGIVSVLAVISAVLLLISIADELNRIK